MLPESLSAKQAYIEMRDTRNAFRRITMDRLAGDVDEFNRFILARLAVDAEQSDLRESLDFAKSEGGILTDEMAIAADAAVAWGVELRRLILGTGVVDL